MRPVIALFVTVACLSASTLTWAADITIENPWIREAPPGVQILAAYLTINNTSNQNDTLLAVQSDCCKKVEIHQSLLENGQAKMIQRKNIPLPAESTITFKPGGLHLMLIKPVQRLRQGDNIDLQFSFASHHDITVKATVKRMTGGEHHQHMHH